MIHKYKYRHVIYLLYFSLGIIGIVTGAVLAFSLTPGDKTMEQLYEDNIVLSEAFLTCNTEREVYKFVIQELIKKNEECEKSKGSCL